MGERGGGGGSGWLVLVKRFSRRLSHIMLRAYVITGLWQPWVLCQLRALIHEPFWPYGWDGRSNLRRSQTYCLPHDTAETGGLTQGEGRRIRPCRYSRVITYFPCDLRPFFWLQSERRALIDRLAVAVRPFGIWHAVFGMEHWAVLTARLSWWHTIGLWLGSDCPQPYVRNGSCVSLHSKRLVRQLAIETARASACIRSQCEKVVNCILAHRGQELLTYSRACVKRRLCCSADFATALFCMVLDAGDFWPSYRAQGRSNGLYFPLGCFYGDPRASEAHHLYIYVTTSLQWCPFIHTVNSILAVGHHIYQLWCVRTT